MSDYDDNLDYDKIDFSKTKRGKSKKGHQRVSLLLIEGLILVVIVIAGAQFLFTDNAEVKDLQATIDSQNIQATESSINQQSALSADQLFARAMTESTNGDIDDAIRSLDLALELDPTYAMAYYERGHLHYDKELYLSASQDFSQAIEFGVSDPEFAYYWRGRSYFEWDDFYKAEPDFDRAFDIDDAFTEALYWRGRTRIELDNYEVGIEDVKQAITMGYDKPAFGYFFIAKAYDDMGDYTSAIAYYDMSLTAVGDDCEEYLCWIDYNNRATSYYRLELYERAVEDYTKAIQVNPDEYPLAMQNRGDAYERLGELTAAMSDRNTMFQLLEGDVIKRSLTAESNTLRATLNNNNSQAHITFEGTSGDIVTISVTVPDDSDLNSMMLLRDPNGTPLVYSSNNTDGNAQLKNIVLKTSGTYTVVVASDLAGTRGEFELHIEG